MADGDNDAAIQEENAWWKVVTIYQIWPHSFLDTSGSGHGDLRGIINKIPYLSSLGIGAIWLSPIYSSPMIDMGYDISDYQNVNSEYGSMRDMEELIQSCHDKGIKILMDLVINHTSDQHEWFLQSKKSRDGDCADYYIWRDPKHDEQGNRRPPNNWGCWFGGSAWEWVEDRQQYYLHLFAKGQPDLNWEPRKVRETVHETAIRFWLRKGVDGFRADTCAFYSKDQDFPDGELGSFLGKDYGNWIPYVKNGPRLLEFWHEIRDEVMAQYPDAIMLGETGGSFSDTIKLVGGGPGRRSMNMVLDSAIFMLTRQKSNFLRPRTYELSELKQAVKGLQQLVNRQEEQAWTAIWKENHDWCRSVNEFGSSNPKLRVQSGKLLAMWTATLSGTHCIYQGEEIGMTNLSPDWTIDEFRDTWSIQYLNKIAKEHPDDKQAQKEALQAVICTSRDNSRTPVQWSSEPHAGFTTGSPWMRIIDNYEEINVSDQLKDKDSLWHFWKKMLEVRKTHADMFIHGAYTELNPSNEHHWAYVKQSKDRRRALVILNFADEESELQIPLLNEANWILLCSSAENQTDLLRPREGRLYLEKI